MVGVIFETAKRTLKKAEGLIKGVRSFAETVRGKKQTIELTSSDGQNKEARKKKRASKKKTAVKKTAVAKNKRQEK